jgi:hypothetical protein
MRRSLGHNFTADLFGGVQAGPGGGPAWAFWGQVLHCHKHRSVGHGRGLTPDTARMSWSRAESALSNALITLLDASIPAASGV